MSEVEKNLDNLEVEEKEEKEETVEKKELTPEQEVGIKRRQFSKLAKELGVEVEKPWAKPEPKQEPKTVEKTEFDDTEHLLLDVKQVPNEARDWLFKEVKSTGKSLRQILDFKYVQEHLTEQRQKAETEANLPGGNNRSGGGSGQSADAWLAKIESGKASLTDIPDFKLRSEVVKLREQTDRNANKPNW